jgi:hypothetical protein
LTFGPLFLSLIRNLRKSRRLNKLTRFDGLDSGTSSPDAAQRRTSDGETPRAAANCREVRRFIWKWLRWNKVDSSGASSWNLFSRMPNQPRDCSFPIPFGIFRRFAVPRTFGLMVNLASFNPESGFSAAFVTPEGMEWARIIAHSRSV